jgi:hypothetical protein
MNEDSELGESGWSDKPEDKSGWDDKPVPNNEHDISANTDNDNYNSSKV